MCGISGIFGLKGLKRNFSRDIYAMSQRLKHRGPDGEGMVFFGEETATPVFTAETPEACKNNALPYSPQQLFSAFTENFSGGFAHRRLSILDLSKSGHQPMCTADKRYWITYNGEIYNYLEIRKQLEEIGVKFFSSSDTEMLVNAYAVWGVTALEKISGMFAFVIYDKEEERIFAARDRFGVKPFYYAIQEQQFIFASEQKAFKAIDFFSSGVNPNAFVDFFYHDTLEREEEGFFKNIFELQPSHFLQLDLQRGELIKKRYYELSFENEKHHPLTIVEQIEKTKLLINESVLSHLQSDVPVGSCLSGGLDSSAIVALASPALKYPIELFTASFPGFAFDESNWAKIIAERVGGHQNYVCPDADGLFSNLESLIYSQDIPLFSTSTFAQHSVMGLAAQCGIKVVLDGQGGDELFGGYPNHYLLYWKRLLHTGQWKKLFQEIDLAPAGMKSGKQLAKHWMVEPITSFAGKVIGRKLIEQARPELNWLNKEFVASANFDHSPKKPNSLNELLKEEFTGVRLKGYLKCEDRAAMWHSVESRTPFTDDHQLVEWVFSLPSDLKIRLGKNKFLLREAMKGLVPDLIIDRKDKLGYVTPNQKWLLEKKEQVLAIVCDKNNPYFEVKEIEKHFENFMEGRVSPNDHRLFKWVSFSIWLKQFGF